MLSGALILLIGWSFGGVVAFEIGCLMVKEGFDVRGVILVDVPCPTDDVPLSTTLLDHIIIQRDPSRSETEATRTIKEQFRKNSALLKKHPPSFDGPYPQIAFLRSREGVKVESGSMREKLPIWLTDREEPETTIGGWEMLLKRKLKWWDVPGNHFQPFMLENVSAPEFFRVFFH